MNIRTILMGCIALFALVWAYKSPLVPKYINTYTLPRAYAAIPDTRIPTPPYDPWGTMIAGTRTAIASTNQTQTVQAIQTQTAIGASMTPINGRTQTKTRTSSRTRTPIPSRTPSITKTTTPTAPYIRNANFENQPNFYWAENNTGGHVIIGNWDYCRDSGCAYFGDYLNDINQRSTISQSIYIPNGKVYLGYFITASTEEIHCGFDYWYVKINSILVQKINICNKNIPWRLYELNIRAYAGKNVTIQFGGVTDDSLKSWWRIDDIYLK